MTMAQRFDVVMDAHADATLAREINRAGSLTRRALAAWASNANLGSGAGSAITAVTEHGDGTATVTISASSGVGVVIDQDRTTATLTIPPTVTDPAWDISSEQWKQVALAFTSTAENSTTDWTTAYTYIEDIGDGRGLTAGIVGWCSGTGDMLTLIRNANLWTPGNRLAKWITPLSQVMAAPYEQRPAKSWELLGAAFVADWQTAGAEPWFQEAQRRERDRVYWAPALAQAKADGVDALGLVALYDISVNHGPGSDPESFGGIVAAAAAKAAPPSKGGSDTAYVEALVAARQAVLAAWGDDQPDGRVAALRHLASTNSLLYSPASWPMYGTTYSTPTPRQAAQGGFGYGFGG